MTRNRATFVRHALTTYGTQLALLPLSLTSSALQARLIGPAGRGQIALLLASVGFASLLLGLGLSSSINFHVSSGLLSPKSLKPLLTRFLLGATCLLGLISAVAWALGVDGWLIGSLPHLPGLIALVMLFAFALVNGWLTAVLVARRAFSRVNRASLIAGALPAIVYSIALAAVGRSEQPAPSTVTFVLSVMVLVETFRCVGLSLGVRQVEEATSSHEAPRLRALLTYSLLAFAADTIQYFTYRADLWIMKAARPDAELGQYSLAVTLAELTLLAAAAFATVLLPHVPTVSPVEAVKTTARVATATLIATTAIAAIGFALAVPLLPVIFTRAFEPSVSLLGVLLLGVVPMSVAKILGNYFAGSGQLKVCLMAAIAGMVVCVTGDVLTIPTYGAMAAAACTAIAYGVFTLFLIVAFLRRSPVPFVQLIDAVRNRRASSAA